MSLQNRVTTTLTDDRIAVLDKVAMAMQLNRAQVAKQMLNETLDALKLILDDAGTSDQIIRKLFKMSMLKMVELVDEADKGFK